MIPLYILFAAVALYFIRKFFKGAQFTENVSAKGKIALVTGANCGLGFQTARELNLRGATVYMLCRNGDRAQEAKSNLTTLGCNPARLIVKIIDLADFSSIRKFVDEIEKELTHVDILVNNAAIMHYPKFELTRDGHEMTWQCNYLGHFLLTELLLPLLKKSENGRIVSVSALLHKFADSVEMSVANDPKKFDFIKPYNRSKLAQIMHCRELTRRMRASDPSTAVTINSLHPGVASTKLQRHTIFAKTPIRQILVPLTWLFLKTEKDCAQTTIFLCLSKTVQSISGRYFKECKEVQPDPKALNDDACNTLYNASLEAVGLIGLKHL